VRYKLVDDEISIQRTTATLLRSRGTQWQSPARALKRSRASTAPGRTWRLLIWSARYVWHRRVQKLRARADVPILVLSVRGDERSKVAALDAGADDYVTKPFSPEELLARVRAGLRRSFAGERGLRGQMAHGDLVIDFDRRRVYRGELEIRLTPKEFDLLTVLAAHAGRVLTHRTILKSIWGANAASQQEHLRVLVGQLRKKLEADAGHPRYLLTEPWVGYRFSGGDP